MEDNKRDEQEFKHVCRLCNKRYPSGKSLGGHMRSHVMANSYASSSLHKGKKRLKKRVESDGYGLRENPRKSWRVVDTKTSVMIANQEVRVCKQCGKAFQSSKALCGHMSSHSQRDRNFTRLKEDDDEEEDDDDDDGDKSWTCEEEDEEGREIPIESHSSNNSGIEQEQEDVALCLMMLSRDSANRVGFNFTAESSDNNSVILEGGSSSNYAAKRRNLNQTSDFYNNGGNVMPFKMNALAAKKKVECVELDNSDSGYFENEAKEQDSDDSVDGYARNYGFKRPKVDDLGGSCSKKLKIEEPRKYQCSICQRTFKTHQALGGHIITHRRDSQSGKMNSVARSDNRNADKKSLMGSKKEKGYCCPYCPKVFKSGQALGGHKRSHLIGSSSQDKASLIKSVEETPPKIRHHHHRLLDLNLPAPAEEDGNQFMPW